MNQPRKAGFTLIEVTIYTLIVALLLGVTMMFISQLVSDGERAKAVSEVQENTQFSMRRIQDVVRGAAVVVQPAAGATSTQLIMQMVDPADDPAQISLDDGVIRLTLGASGPQRLTSDRVRVKDLVFEHLAAASAPPDLLQVSFTVEHVQLGQRPEYAYSLPVETSLLVPR